MKGRFRIRTRDGKELRPETTDVFAELIRTGVVCPEDVVFDALTGKWIPVESHPLARLARDPLVTGQGPPAATAAAGAHSGDAGVGGGDVLAPSLELVDAPPTTPEEEARAFIRRMEEERQADPDEPALSREVPLVLEGRGGAGSAREAEALLQPVKGRESTPPPREHPSATQTAREAPRGPDAGADRSGSTELLPTRKIALTGLVAALSLGGLAIFAAVARPSPRVGDRMPELAETPGVTPRPGRHLDDTEEAVRGAATAGFLESVDHLRRDLGVEAVPAAWLTGRYLSNPTDHPEVQRYWERYLSYVEQAKASEGSLYRGAYLGALDEAGATGPVRSLRLATALRDFDAAAPARGEAYARAWELAASALALHDTLVELRGRIRYEPARGPRVSADPVIEAVGTDSDAQLRFDAALDRVLNALKAGDHPLDPEAIPDWLARSLRQAQGSASPAERGALSGAR
ncbi:MAG: hypothetical protein LJF04_07745 [Gemmatimonadetes bacterium]|nr:hypothetical protein [Gemmatimonadota bacterium]